MRIKMLAPSHDTQTSPQPLRAASLLAPITSPGPTALPTQPPTCDTYSCIHSSASSAMPGTQLIIKNS